MWASPNRCWYIFRWSIHTYTIQLSWFLGWPTCCSFLPLAKVRSSKEISLESTRSLPKSTATIWSFPWWSPTCNRSGWSINIWECSTASYTAKGLHGSPSLIWQMLPKIWKLHKHLQEKGGYLFEDGSWQLVLFLPAALLLSFWRDLWHQLPKNYRGWSCKQEAPKISGSYVDTFHVFMQELLTEIFLVSDID